MFSLAILLSPICVRSSIYKHNSCLNKKQKGKHLDNNNLKISTFQRKQQQHKIKSLLLFKDCIAIKVANCCLLAVFFLNIFCFSLEFIYLHLYLDLPTPKQNMFVCIHGRETKSKF